jgi:hypothetical protein
VLNSTVSAYDVPNEVNNDLVMPCKKYRGIPIRDVVRIDRPYAEWVLVNATRMMEDHPPEWAYLRECLETTDGSRWRQDLMVERIQEPHSLRKACERWEEWCGNTSAQVEIVEHELEINDVDVLITYKCEGVIKQLGLELKGQVFNNVSGEIGVMYHHGRRKGGGARPTVLVYGEWKLTIPLTQDFIATMFAHCGYLFCSLDSLIY